MKKRGLLIVVLALAIGSFLFAGGSSDSPNKEYRLAHTAADGSHFDLIA